MTDRTGQLQIISRECDVLILGVGTLNDWKYPDIDGISNYKGRLMHTATWDDSMDLKGKSVAVIGNGASAVQCVAALQTGKLYPGAAALPEAVLINRTQRLGSYITICELLHGCYPMSSREATYKETVSFHLRRKLPSQLTISKDSAEECQRFEEDPAYYQEYCRGLEKTLAGAFEALWRGSSAQKDVERLTISHMKEIIHDHKVLNALIPKFEVGCRRFTPGDHYLHAIQQDNVEMLSDRIVSITETGITDSTGVTRDVDAIICATGFDASYEPRFPVIGRDGYSLAENWGVDKPTESYMAATVARFPNFFGEFANCSYSLRFLPLPEENPWLTHR